MTKERRGILGNVAMWLAILVVIGVTYIINPAEEYSKLLLVWALLIFMGLSSTLAHWEMYKEDKEQKEKQK